MSRSSNKDCPRCRRIVDPRSDTCLKCGADLRPSKVLQFLAVGSATLALAVMWMAVAR